MLKQLTLSIAILLLSGCASYGVISNESQTASSTSAVSYSIRSQAFGKNSGDVSLILAFSGGGTRAAALAYGVMEELRDTSVVIDGRPVRVLDEVDAISSVSGGSFTSAYYGLYGERLFEDFKDVFLTRNVQGQLIRGLLNPLRWFSSTGRTEMAVKFYEEVVFDNTTFADMKHKDGPLILINASDLGNGVRFSFVQEYFNLLCSDLSSFPVARAVTASSAVPVLFNPVVVKNYYDCKKTLPDVLVAAEKYATNNPELTQVVDGLKSYFNKDGRQYVHFVDGGITDNLGLRAIYEVIEINGGAKGFFKRFERKPPRALVIISVNASTNPEPEMNKSNKQPSLEETINAVSDAQLHRYNVATLELINRSMKRWVQETSTPNWQVTPYFIKVGFRDIRQPEKLRFLNRIPTSFSLTEEQVDRLITTGRELLRNNPDYQRFVAELDGTQPAGR